MPNMAASVDGITIIVHKENTAEKIKVADLADYFLKRKRHWPNGTQVRFIDRKPSPERKIFLEKILKKTAEEVDLFWIGQKLYSGDSAPVQSDSDKMSIHFVATFKGAIGYVSSRTVIDNENVKEIKIGD